MNETLVLLIIAFIIIVIMLIEKIRTERNAMAKITFNYDDIPIKLMPKDTKLKHPIYITVDGKETEELSQYNKHPLHTHPLNVFYDNLTNFCGKLKRVFKSKTPFNALFMASNTGAKTIIGLNPLYIQPVNYWLYTHIDENFESYIKVEEKHGKKPIITLFIL